MPTREKRARSLGLPIDQLPDGRGRHGHHVRGETHPRWNATKILTKQGYVKLRVGRTHPLADPNGYAYEHVVAWVAAGNPEPREDEVLHHRNGNKTDNRIENLELFTRGEHNSEHLETRERDERGRLLPRGAPC